MKMNLILEMQVKFSETGQIENIEEVLETVRLFHESKVITDGRYLRIYQALTDPLFYSKFKNEEQHNV